MQLKIYEIAQTINRSARCYKMWALFWGTLVVAALPPFYCWWLIAPCFGGLIWLCNGSYGWRHLAAIGYWFGFGYFAAGFYWIGNALLVDVAKTGWLYLPVLLINGAFFGIFTILPTVATKFGSTLAEKILCLVIGWGIGAEWVRGFFLTGFPWNPLSSMLSFSAVWLQSLAIFGTYGLSMILLLMAALPAVWILQPQKRNLWAPLVSLLMLGMLWGYGEYRLADYRKYGNDMVAFAEGERQIQVRLVQPSIPQSLKWNRETRENNFAQYLALSTQTDNRHIDFTVWGETASPFDFNYDTVHARQVRAAVPPQGYLISGMLRYEMSGADYVLYNSLAVINKDGQVVAGYDKTHLVPFGEYIPFRAYLPQWVRPIANTVAEFGRGIKYQTIAVEGHPEFAPLICYEIIFSDEVVSKERKPKWLVVLTNDGWYGQSAGPYQHLAAAQMRAVEEGISIVRSANSGISAVINPYGIITQSIGLDERDFVDATVNPNLSQDTLFGKYGNRMMGFVVVLLLVMLVAIRWQNRNEK